VDTDGNGTVDSYLYSNAGSFANIKKGANITLTVAGDTLTIAGPGASGTADSIAVDTDGNGTIDNYLYSTSGAIAMLKAGTGATLTVNTDTVTIAVTLGTDIVSGEIVDQTITKSDVDTTASNFPFDDAYHVTSNVADSEYASFRYAQARAGDSAAALRNGDTWTGTHDYGGATAMEIPNGVNPTISNEGEIAWDTDDDALETTDGTNDFLIPFQKTISLMIWDPELITDTVPIFYCDSTIYQGGITLTSFEAQTNVDGAYTLNLYEFDTADPPARVGAGTIAALAFAAADQRDQTTTFSDVGIARGGHVYLLTPSTNISWLRVSITFRVNENN
jgi:hypothetical protein